MKGVKGDLANPSAFKMTHRDPTRQAAERGNGQTVSHMRSIGRLQMAILQVAIDNEDL